IFRSGMQQGIELEPVLKFPQLALIASDHAAVTPPDKLYQIVGRLLCWMSGLVLQPRGKSQGRLGIISLKEEIAVLVPSALDEVALSWRLVRIIARHRRHGKGKPIERCPPNLKLK